MKKIIATICITFTSSIILADTLEKFQIKPPIMCSDNMERDYFMHKNSALYTPVIESQTFYINADQISGSHDEAHFAHGNVQAYKDAQSLLSDWLYLQQEEYNHVIAGDHFIFTREYDIISGEYFDYYFDLNKGTIKNGEVFDKKKNLTIKSQSMEIHDRKHFDVIKGMFTSCKADDPDWYIAAETMNFDYQKSEAEGKYGTLYFESVPLIKGKNIMFPLGERKSGWLRPTVGLVKSNITNGYVAIPYYWNIAPNYDNTITPKLWTSSGLMIADEQRYLMNDGRGTWYTEQVPYDFYTEKYRWLYDINGTEFNNSNQDISFDYKYKQVSDQNYFLNFTDYDTVTKNVALEQSLTLGARENWGNSSIVVQNYQMIVPQGYQAPAPIYTKLPQISYTSTKPNIYGFEPGINTNYTYFYNQQQQNGNQSAQRLFLYPSLSYPIENQWGFIKPEIDEFLDYYYVYDSHYVNNNTQEVYLNGSTASITAPVLSVDSGLKFDKIYNDYHITQTFEPRLFYVYIPQVNQTGVHVFDTSTATYNYNQLFLPLNFAGYDRVNQANNATIGFMSKVINDLNSSQSASLGVAYQQSFLNSSTAIYGDPNKWSQLYLPQPNFIFEATGNPNKHNAFNAGIQLDTTTRNPISNQATKSLPKKDNFDNFSLGYQFNPEDYKVLNAKFNYQYHLPLLYYDPVSGQQSNADYENQYALDLSGQWPIYKDKVLITGRGFYDLTKKRMLNVLGGFTYNGGCWSTSLIGQDYVANLTQRQWNVMLELEFNQIGKLAGGTNLDNSLKTNIPGYKSL